MGYDLIQWQNNHLNDEDWQWKIALPSSLLDDTIKWFHKVCEHAGESRVYDTIQTRYYHLQLKHQIEELIPECNVC